VRVESRVFSLSWVPSDVVTGLARLPFDLSIAPADSPPPTLVTHPYSLVRESRVRHANALRAWAKFDEQGRPTEFDYDISDPDFMQYIGKPVSFGEFPELRHEPRVEGDSVTFVQSAGGRVGGSVPHHVRGKTLFRFAAPVAWTTLALTISSDGSSRGELVGASSFPRHWVYGADGVLQAKSAEADYARWLEEGSPEHTPWGAEDSELFVTTAESALERYLAGLIMASKPEVETVMDGTVLTRRGERDNAIFLVLNGVLDVEVDGHTVAEVGPGAIVGERASLEGRRSATLVARTTCRVVMLDPSALTEADREEIAAGHRREDDDPF
jgi:Cyclic nucleotide-binding domain